jgi:hypothetical protein
MDVRLNPGMTNYMPLRPQTTRAMERTKKVGTAIQPRVMMSIGLAQLKRGYLEVIPFYERRSLVNGHLRTPVFS